MKVIVSKTCANVSGAEMLTSGMVGKTIDVEFSADWIGLTKIAVFTNGETTRDVLDPNGSVVIPWEVLVKPNKRVSVGFYGYKIENGEKVLAIPTIWAELGAIRAGADPSEDPSAELSPTVAEQLQSDVNDLDERVTEIEEHGGGGGTSDHTQLTNRDASNQHPMSAISGLEDALDSKQPSGDYATTQELDELANIVDGKGTYSKPSGGIPKTDLASAVQASLGRADSALQEHQSLSAYRTSAAQDIIDNGKQPTISDLATIRSGAALGATALQAVPNTYRTAAAQDEIDNGKVDKVTGKGLSTNDYTDADKAKVASAVQPSELITSKIDLSPTDAYEPYYNTQKDVNSHLYEKESEWDAKLDASDLSDYALKTDLPQNVSELTNDSGYLTLSTLPIYDGGVE